MFTCLKTVRSTVATPVCTTVRLFIASAFLELLVECVRRNCARVRTSRSSELCSHLPAATRPGVKFGGPIGERVDGEMRRLRSLPIGTADCGAASMPCPHPRICRFRGGKHSGNGVRPAQMALGSFGPLLAAGS